MYPRDALYRNNQNIDKVILFSYSGTTNDIMNSVKEKGKKEGFYHLKVLFLQPQYF